ncbi:hypothetical protein DAPPUDRAFT_323929 [Daphnia pulex]|uniref:Vitellogenin domain-containing protein n=1 Tax=Daphnia pulex TaxID=6669 RepID=E9H082_DAPPU|nr:hypothetical protein DAPPUDRAFT_323929 [Daphnia pulex]|eukprot:EFX74857.1 hypothetical protein DAPPUDRAFT_323929 [Daphnia pulex]
MKKAPWAAGSEYVYRMHAISVSDIPELGPQAAGVKFDSQLTVQCRDAGSIVVKLVDVTAWNFHTDVGESWSELESSQLGTQVVVEGKYFLEKPFVIRHREGLFESLVVSADEPFWSINMKKAVASKLQLHVSGSRSVESASRNFGLPTEDSYDDVNSVFKVFESGVTGECETLYEIAPLSDALIRSDSKLNPMPKLCVEGTFFQVVKTKDYSKCRLNKPVYTIIAPSGWQCKSGVAACGTARSRSSVNRYIACGSLESFTLLKMTHQGEVRTSPYAYDTEQLRSLSLMKLTLQAVRHASSSSALPPKDLDSGLAIGSLVYSFPGTNASSSSWLSDGLMRMPLLRDPDQLHQGVDNLLEEVDRLLAKAVDQMEVSQEEAAVDTISAISHLVRHLDYQKISSLVGEIGHRSTLERSILLDAVIAAGSNPTVTFLKEAILSRRLTKSESLQAISGFPLYVRTPTAELLNELFTMLKATSAFSGSERPIYHSAMMSVSQLAHVACVNVSEARTRFPAGLYGDFCQPNDAFITSRLVPLLYKEINGGGSIEDKMVALTALGEIGHESILSVVLPIIKAKGDYSPLIRTKAVISLHKIAHDSNAKVIQVLSTTFQNPNESSEVRMAAFTLLILANPPAYRWQRIAVSTWFEHSAQVASFVYTTLSSLASNIEPVENLKELSEKAQIVLPLAKRVPLGLKYSYNLKRSQLVAERNAGAEFHSEMFNSEESIFPKSLYSRLSWVLGPYHFDIFEFEAYGENWRSAWDRIVAKFNPSSENGDSSQSRNSGRFREFDLHPDLRRVKKQLNAKSPIPAQDAGSADAFLHLSLMKAVHHFTSFDEAVITDLIQSLLASSSVSVKREFSRRKWMPLTHAEVLVPSTLGFMISTRTQTQVLTSFKGDMQITNGGFSDFMDLKKWASSASIKNLGLELDVKPTIVVKLMASMSVNVEFTKAIPVSGVDTHVTLSLPGRLTLGVELDNWKLMTAWKPASSGPAGLTTLYHYRVRPFTALQALGTDLPINPSPGESKDVHAFGVTPQTVAKSNHQYPVGGKTGLKLDWTSRSELPASANHRSIWQEPLSKILMDANFALLPVSLHLQSYRVTLDPIASETTKIVFSLNLDAADKLDRGTQVYSTGSKSPAAVKEPANRIQYLSNNMEPQIKKKLNKVLGPVPKGSAIHVDAKFIMEKMGSPPKIYGASFAGAYGTEGTKLAVNAQLELPINQEVSDPFTLCIEGGGNYPRLPSLDRRTLIETAMEASWNANIGFGDSCSDHQIVVDVGMRRSETFGRYVEDSPENRDCIMHESRGEFSHEQCLAVKELATVLDEYDATVKYGHMLPILLNATLGIEGWLKSKFYPHLSENRVGVNNANKQLRISAKVQPSLSAVDLMFFKPQSNTLFRELPLSDTANVVFPISAKSSFIERLIDNTISDGFAPICRLERNSITTFDKVQYNAHINDCEHVVLTVPGIETLAVLMRQDGENKTVTLLVGRDKLEVSAASLKIRYNDMDVVVTEDQPLEVHHAEQAYQSSSRPSIGVYKIGPAAFKLSSHSHDIHIVSDASSSVTVKAPRSFQGKMIGLCGNMDGEIVSELRDPQRCTLSSGTLMAASYQLNDGHQGRTCLGLPDKVRGQLREEQNTCHNKHDRDSKEPPIYPSPPSSPPTDSCIIRRTLVVVRSSDEARCFSTSIVKECRASCYGPSKPTIIGFHCVTNPKLGEELEQEAKHKVLTFMLGKKEDIRTTRYLPTVCRPNVEQVDSMFT